MNTSDEKMRIRKLCTKDAPYMLEWMHDKEVTRYLLKNFDGYDITDCKRFIENSYNDLVNLHMAIVSKDDEYMGTVSLKNIHDHVAELGLVMRSCAMARGYSSFAFEEIIIKGRAMGIDHIYWCVEKENARAIAFYKKRGYDPAVMLPKADWGGTHSNNWKRCISITFKIIYRTLLERIQGGLI